MYRWCNFHVRTATMWIWNYHWSICVQEYIYSLVLCRGLKVNKTSRPGQWSGCKTKKNRAVAKATGRQRSTVLSNKSVGINNASSVSGNMMAELKPTVLRWSKCKRDGWISKSLFCSCLLLPSDSPQSKARLKKKQRGGRGKEKLF